MYFCSGPPRAYAATASASVSASPFPGRDAIEDVAVVVDPFDRVLARVTATHVGLWAASPRGASFHAALQRHLVTIPRAGRFVADVTDAAAIHPRPSSVEDDGDTDGDGLQRLWAVWLADDRLAVLERGSHVIEFYAFDGLPPPLSDPASVALGADGAASGGGGGGGNAPSTASTAIGASDRAHPASPTSTIVTGRFLGDFAVNHGDNARDREDAACAMSGLAGGTLLFIGMASGLIAVAEVPPTAAAHALEPSSMAQFWKIDVLVHLTHDGSQDDARDDGDRHKPPPPPPPSCYALTTATWEPPGARAALLYLVACFEGGRCFIMLLSPSTKSIEQLLSLVNTEREASAACFGRCTTVALEPQGSRLALGWSDGGVSLFRLAVTRPTIPPPASSTRRGPNAPAPPVPVQLELAPIRELTMTYWGYTTADLGAVTSLAWSHDARAIAVGYALRGFAVFSTDGCRLMSSLPQHNQPRAVSSAGTTPQGATPATPLDAEYVSAREVCTYGTLRLAWAQASTSLVVIARGKEVEEVVRVPTQRPAPAPTSPTATSPPLSPSSSLPQLAVEDLFEPIEVELLKDEDGLCLSLSGSPGRPGAWVRSEQSFTRRRRDGGVGPAEASGRIRGGDLLVAINDNDDIAQLPFERVIRALKEVAVDTTMRLTFWRLQWSRVFTLAMRALSSSAFLVRHGINLEEDDDFNIREYALQMQARQGDCDLAAQPSLLDLERRAKFDGWAAIQGTTPEVAQHKYLKLVFGLFPTAEPRTILQNLVEVAPRSPRSRHRSASTECSLNKVESGVSHRRRYRSQIAFYEYDFARSIKRTGATSKLVLLESTSLRLVPARTLDDPCALVACPSWRVPADYEAKWCPLRLVAVSPSGNQIAVAGQRGFCLLNRNTAKWRLFGNVNEEHDLLVQSLLWIHEDAVMVCFTRASEDHAMTYLRAYPRDHLDDASVLDTLSFERAAEAPKLSGTGSKVQPFDALVVAMERDDDSSHAFCFTRSSLWAIAVDVSGNLKSQDFKIALTRKRVINLPSSLIGPVSANGAASCIDFTVLPRMLHVRDDDVAHKRRQQTGVDPRSGQKPRRQSLDDDEESGGWFTSFVNMIAGGEVPDQYQPDEVLPRFAVLDSFGNVIVWDPENRSQRVICGNITTVIRTFVSPSASPTWPAPCRLLYGLYGPEGLRLWLPLLDGVYPAHTRAFEADPSRLETFLSCHDPLRAKTYEIEFGTAPATAELYEHVIREYGIELEHFITPASRAVGGAGLENGISNQRGCIATVDDPASLDGMLRFDADVQVLGIESSLGLLVGASQDVYMPSGLALPCYDVFCRVQPLFHTILCYLVRNRQLLWARRVLDAVRHDYALSTPTQELFLHAMLEACFRGDITTGQFQEAIQLLMPLSRRLSTGTECQVAGAADAPHTGQGDIDEYCEIVAHVARKSEPSRLKLLFPLVGDPLELLALCRKRGELRTAANFLLILEECSPEAGAVAGDSNAASSLAYRSACAAELVAQCIEHDELALAKQVVRVARDWENPSDAPGVEHLDEQLGSITSQALLRNQFERAVWCIEELQARLPVGAASEHTLTQDALLATQTQLRATFVETNRQRQLGILLAAVTEANFSHWVQAIHSALGEPPTQAIPPPPASTSTLV